MPTIIHKEPPLGVNDTSVMQVTEDPTVFPPVTEAPPVVNQPEKIPPPVVITSDKAKQDVANMTGEINQIDSSIASAQNKPKTFYRVGQDIFDASTGRKLGITEWNRDWTGRADEVSPPAGGATATATEAPTVDKKETAVPTEFWLRNDAGGEMKFSSKEERDAYYDKNQDFWNQPDDYGTPTITEDQKTLTAQEEFSKQVNDLNTKYEAEAADYRNKLDQIMNGTYPLTDDQKATLAAMNEEFEMMISEQKAANKDYEGAVRLSGIRANRNMYAPEMYMGEVKSSIDSGLKAVRAIEIKQIQTVNAAKEAIKKGNAELLKQAYESIKDSNEQKTKAIESMYKATQDAITNAREDAKAKLEQAKYEFDVEKFYQQPIIDASEKTQDFIYDMVKKYPDAGIDEKDTMQTMMEKVKKSAIYLAELAKTQAEAEAKKEDVASTDLAQAIMKDPTILATLTGGDKGKVLAQIAGMGGDVSSLIRNYGGLTEEQSNAVMKMNEQFSGKQLVKDFVVISGKADSIKRIIENGSSGPGDLALVFEFMKALDPTSVVRESEYESASKSGNVFLGWAAKLNGMFTEEGQKLPESVRNEFLEIANDKMDAVEQQYVQLREQYGKQVDMMTKRNDGSDFIFEYRTGGRLTAAELSKKYGVEEKEIQESLDAGFSQEDIENFLKEDSPKAEPPVSEAGGTEAKKVADAIGQYESGGNYQARGPVVTSGMYNGERAMGKYQIMPGNLPSWSKQALGREVTEEEFMSSPEIQDSIAQYMMQKHIDAGYGIDDIASIWFSGKPLSQAGNAKDVIGTTVPNYVKAVSSIYNKNT